ncbi:HD domain-containing protein [Desulfoluna spongiiphila]|uniref:5'-deoxynucleotidase n=1 Tax=Desulfoluna spongiiphila TaxID=419481 RepID=A0A1G5GCC1_9BACT|nr:HD domain-containing protein [Desulfoluna spongiiphila]SCY49203.1 putative hydrolases of HD superfamily [Desulfoluna spongiiphila]
MEYDQIIAFLKEVETFKTCERTCRTTRAERPESDAEHSWHLALFLMLIEDELEGVDRMKLLQLALIHDLPEIYAGDTNPYRGNTDDKEENEKKAAKKLFSQLPAALETKLSGLFAEYMAQETAEAKIVKSADKLMPLIQNLCTNKTHSSYRKLSVTHEEVEAYMGPYFQSGGMLKMFYDKLLAEARECGVFHGGKEN